MSVTIPLTRGLSAIIDEADAEKIGQHSWFALSNGQARGAPRYVAARTCNEGGGRQTILMHRQILMASKGCEVDHINRDPLDNRRANLRPATRSQNCANVSFKSALGYRGVSPHRRRFKAIGSVNGVVHRLGHFATAVEAARAYDAFARAHHGQFATLNFPDAAPHSEAA